MAIPIHSEDNLIGTLQTSVTSILQDGISVIFTDRITGESREPDANTRLFVIDKGAESSPNDSYEVIYAVNGHTTTNGITTFADGVIRGLGFVGESLLSVEANRKTHRAGAEVGCNVNHFFSTLIAEVLAGNISSGGNTWKIGDATDTTKSVIGEFTGGDVTLLEFQSDGTTNINVGGILEDISTLASHGVSALIKDHADVDTAVSDSMAQGDILFADATPNINRLSAGTTGQVLSTQGAGSNPVWVDLPKISDIAYGPTWDGNTDGASKNAIYDTIESIKKYNSGVFSKNLSDVSQSQVIPHGLGRVPKFVKLHGKKGGGSSGTYIDSVGVFIPSSNAHSCIITYNAASTYTSNQQSGITTSYTILFNLYTDSGGWNQQGVVSADDTNITISWTKNGTPDGTAHVMWEAE